jgi:hypothetical protein
MAPNSAETLVLLREYRSQRRVPAKVAFAFGAGGRGCVHIAFAAPGRRLRERHGGPIQSCLFEGFFRFRDANGCSDAFANGLTQSPIQGLTFK